MKKTFEDCIAIIEHTLGLQLLTWQKETLRMVYENKPFPFIVARGMGLTTFDKALILLAILKKEE